MPMSSSARRPTGRPVGRSPARGSGASRGGARFRAGQPVQARYKGGMRYYPGTIARSNSDGTFDIDYDDGDSEKRVAAHKIRAVNEQIVVSDDSRSPRSSPRVTSPGAAGGQIALVTELQAAGSSKRDIDRYKRAFEMYDKRANGKVTGRDFGRVLNGFKINFVPGDLREAMTTYGEGMNIDYVQLLDAVAGVSNGRGGNNRGSFDEDEPIRSGQSGTGGDDLDQVAAILQDAGMQSRDITEKKIENFQDNFEMIDTDAKGVVNSREFDRIVQRLLPKLNATTVRDLGMELDNGRGQIRYQAFVKAIRQVSQRGGASRGGRGGRSPASSASGGQDSIVQGSRVEARYKGGSRYYKGKVTRVNRDGSFDILYDDGDRESRVAPNKVRGLDAPLRSKGRALSDDEGGEDAEESFAIGSSVQARYKGGSKYFGGKITRVNRDGTFDILYDDGDRESRVSKSKIRGQPSKSARGRSQRGGKMSDDFEEPLSGEQSEAAIEVGTNVEARYKGGSKFYKGKVTRVNRDGSFDILYDDGDRESRVPARNVRALARGSPTRGAARRLGFSSEEEGDDYDDDILKPTGRIERGSLVEARYKGGSKFYKGKVTRVNADGSFAILYDDGDREARVPKRNVRLMEEAAMDVSADEEISVGSTVEAKYKGGSKFYKGKVTRVNADGSFAILYDDGDREARVPKRNVRLVGGGSKRSSSPRSARRGLENSDASDMGENDRDEIRVGSQVEARYKGGSKYYRGTVQRVNADGSYAIRYDDGDRETRVPSRLVRSIGGGGDRPSRGGASPDRKDRIRIGSVVEARYKGGSKYYRGKVARVNADGSFKVTYDDGDSELRVPKSSIRLINARSPRSSSPNSGGRDDDDEPLKRGDRVEARFKGGKKFYPGKIARVNADGSYDVAYDDGDSERRIDPASVRALGRSRSARRSSSPSKRESRSSFRVGTRVEARYKGGKKYFKGEVTRVNANGTFDIRYDDGDRERGVPEDLMKKLSGALEESDSDLDEPRVGDRVEAKYRGRGTKWYKGKISKKHRDGTFNVDYDDGDADFNLAAKFVRKLASSPKRSSPRSARSQDRGESNAFSRGERVEARYKGGSKYYKGEISRVNPDDTYDILYDDGDRESRVAPSKIVSLEKRRSSSRSPRSARDDDRDELAKDDRVEARYKGGSKYYKGKITRVNANGTFDILYDDGDRESRVAKSLIRKVRSSPRSSGKRRVTTSSSSSSSDAEEPLAEMLRRVLRKGIKEGALDDYHEVFDMFDRDNDGFVSRSEFSRALDRLGFKFTSGELRRVIKSIDTDRDGRVSYREFMKLVKGSGGRSKSRSRSRSRSPTKRSRRFNTSSDSSSSDEKRSARRSRHSRSRSPRKSAGSAGRRSQNSRRRPSRYSDDEASSDWSSGEDSADDETWDSDSDAEQDRLLVKFESYFGRAAQKDSRKKRVRRAFERLDRAGKGKIRSDELEKALRYTGINKRVSRALRSKLVEKYGRGTSDDIYYRDMVTGCKETLTAVREGRAPSFENQIDDIIQRFQSLATGKDVATDLAKLDKHGDLLLSKKAIVSYLVSLGFKKSERSVLLRFVSHFEQTGSRGKIPYHDFAKFCMDKERPSSEMPSWKRATAAVDIAQGLRRLREEREQREKDGMDPLVWQVLSKLRIVVGDALQKGLAKDYRDAFELFDANKDGAIDKEEMAAALERIGFDVHDEEVGKIMRKLDPDGKGRTIDYKHFLGFATRGSDRDQWALAPDGTIVGNTFAGELEGAVRQRIRSWSLKSKVGHHSMLRAFRHLDSDGKGWVDQKGLRKVASKFGWKLTKEQLAVIMARFDLKGNNRFSYKSFVNFLTLEDDAIYQVEQRIIEFVASLVSRGTSMRQAFEMFDRKKCGFVSEKDLCSSMIKIGFPVAEQEARELIRRVDVDRDGKISFAEFVRAFAPTTSASTTDPGSTAIVSQQDLENARSLGNTGTSHALTDWGHVPELTGKLPLAPKGSLGEWLEKRGSAVEQRNFFAFVQMISNFEKRLGLQQTRGPSEGVTADREIMLQLGTKLNVFLRFQTEN